jgi:hypothetical protein
MDNRNYIDMAPYEEQFTKLERLFFEQKSAMNIVAYIADRQFNDAQYNKVFDHYSTAYAEYEKYLKIFEREILIPNIEGVFNWEADFERRVVYYAS